MVLAQFFSKSTFADLELLNYDESLILNTMWLNIALRVTRLSPGAMHRLGAQVMRRWIVIGLANGLAASGLLASSILLSNVLLSNVLANPVLAATGAMAASDGDSLLQKGWVNDAIAAYKKALKANPQDLNAQRGLAQAYQKNGQTAEAWAAYQQVLALNPSDRLALRQVGILGEYRPEWQTQGIAALTDLLKLAPSDVEALVQRAKLLSYQQQLPAAIADYDQAFSLQLDPQKNPTWLEAAADTLSAQPESRAKALTLYQRLSDRPPILIKRLVLSRQLDRISAADFLRQVALVANPLPGDKPDRQAMASAFVRLDKPDPQLMPLYQSLLDSGVDAPFLQFRIAQMQVQQGDFAAARARLEAYRQTPVGAKDTASDSLLADIERQELPALAKQNPALAQARLAEYLRLHPGDIGSYFLQGEVARASKNWPLAEQSFRQILQVQPDNTDAMAALGGLLFERQRYAEATQVYQRVTALKPDAWDAYRILAELNLVQDQPWEALRQFKLLRQLQAQKGLQDPAVADRIAQIETDSLRRRSFQPAWEGYTKSSR
jgi:tetratricopeptide (TPR) repeat protein